MKVRCTIFCAGDAATACTYAWLSYLPGGAFSCLRTSWLLDADTGLRARYEFREVPKPSRQRSLWTSTVRATHTSRTDGGPLCSPVVSAQIVANSGCAKAASARNN